MLRIPAPLFFSSQVPVRKETGGREGQSCSLKRKLSVSAKRPDSCSRNEERLLHSLCLLSVCSGALHKPQPWRDICKNITEIALEISSFRKVQESIWKRQEGRESSAERVREL